MAPKTALVTGAGTGIVKAAALALIQDGWRVALVGRRKALLYWRDARTRPVTGWRISTRQ